MTDFNHGIKSLNKSIENLHTVERDISSNSQERIKSDWDKACSNIKDAYKDLTGIHVDAKLRKATLEAYGAFNRAKKHPDNPSYIQELSRRLHSLVDELQAETKKGQL